jgi:Sulfotransferase domain
MGEPSSTSCLGITVSATICPLVAGFYISYCHASSPTLADGHFPHQAVTDAPCVNFADELLAAYPDAKVVLTTRDVEKWLPSMERSYYKILAWKWWLALAAVDDVSIHDRQFTTLPVLTLRDSLSKRVTHPPSGSPIIHRPPPSRPHRLDIQQLARPRRTPPGVHEALRAHT